MEKYQSMRYGSRDCDRRVLRQTREVRSGNALDSANVTRLKCRHARWIARDHTKRYLIPRRFGAPVTIVARELDAIAFYVAGEPERPRAYRRLAGVKVCSGSAF